MRHSLDYEGPKRRGPPSRTPGVLWCGWISAGSALVCSALLLIALAANHYEDRHPILGNVSYTDADVYLALACVITWVVCLLSGVAGLLGWRNGDAIAARWLNAAGIIYCAASLLLMCIIIHWHLY
jgi:hypothetical protein